MQVASCWLGYWRKARKISGPATNQRGVAFQEYCIGNSFPFCRACRPRPRLLWRRCEVQKREDKTQFEFPGRDQMTSDYGLLIFITDVEGSSLNLCSRNAANY